MARDQLDLVVLKNGDRVHGEIISLYSATLVVRTLSLGTVEIDWPEVVALESPQLFEVELTNGRRLAGSFAAQAPPGNLLLGSGAAELVQPAEPADSSDHLLELPAPAAAEVAVALIDKVWLLHDVVVIRQRGATLWQSHRGYLDLGFNYAAANQDAELTVAAEFSLRGPRVRWTNDLSVSVRDDDVLQQRQRLQVRSFLEFPAGRRWILGLAGLHQRNDDLDLEARESIYAGAFWVAARSAAFRLLFGGGAAGSSERYFGEENSTTVTSGLAMVSVDFDRFGLYSTHTTFALQYLPAIDSDGRYRIEAQAQLRQKIARDFSISLSPYYSYDSQPPRENLLHEDWGLTSSIGWVF